jgi:hypothetical protein
VVLPLLLLPSTPIRGQEVSDTVRVTIRGRVIDQITENPVPHASIRLDGANVQVFSNSLGRFRLPDLPLGTYSMRVESYGYEPLDGDLRVVREGEMVITLVPEPIALEEIRVQAERLEARRRTVAMPVRTLDAVQMENSNAMHPLHLVYNTLGCSLMDITWQRCPRFSGYSVVIDEVRMQDGAGWLQAYPLEYIYEIEIYTRCRMVRMYTKRFMQELARTNRRLEPIICW